MQSLLVQVIIIMMMGKYCDMKILVTASVREKIESLEQTVTTTRNAVAEVKVMR